MEEQPTDAPTQKSKRARNINRFYALLSLIVFVGLIIAVSAITHNNSNKKHQAQSVARTAEVRITAKGFVPATLVVKPGTKITWTNTDSKLHQVVSNPFPSGKDLPGLKSEILNNFQTYTYDATTTGSFGYHDQIKPTINGTIIVKN